MDWLQFIAAIIGSLAWPVTIFAGFYLLKRHLPALFPFVEKLKYKDFEVEFRKSVQELTEKSRDALPVQDIDDQTAPPRDHLYTLAEVSPRSAILEAWLQVETAAAQVIQSREPQHGNKTRMVSPLRLAEKLNRCEIINAQQLEIFHRLRDLRNKAVHIGDATFQLDETLEYIDLASSLASQIRRGAYDH